MERIGNGFLKPYICTQCGGQVDRLTLTCEMCGTKFKEDDGAIRFECVRPGVHVLGMRRELDDEAVRMLPPKEVAELVMQDICRELAQCIAPYVDVKYMDNPVRCTKDVYAKVRVLDRTFVF